MSKRALDLIVSVVLLVMLWPALVVISVLVRLDSPGPALFRQERVGLGGTVFRIRKFRTLRAHAAGPLISPTGDTRVTRVGAVLRRTKLDELPQLLDVVEGRMSLVGPRPEVPQYVEMWPPDLREVILSVRPGITDPASVAFRDESELLAGAEDPEGLYLDVILPEKARMYAEYVRTRSFVKDVRVLLDTLGAVLGRHEGAAKPPTH
ncbi:MAG: sugar transferase [Nocardioides sp.]|jgi:lipopolysaccharide/colanic/teichoic acid biosynthesis glycosyltransferase